VKASKVKIDPVCAESGPMLDLFSFCLLLPELLFVVPKSESNCGRGRMSGFQLNKRIALREGGWQMQFVIKGINDVDRLQTSRLPDLLDQRSPDAPSRLLPSVVFRMP
jgi:hypothetical protein